MVLLCPRIHFFEINDQPWYKSQQKCIHKLTVPSRWPNYLREKVQSGLTLAWTFRMPVLQKTSPAQLVASTLRLVLSSSVTNYTYVDFCAGAGGPTPFIEQDLNEQLRLDRQTSFVATNGHTTKPNASTIGEGDDRAVKFVLTDLHPHIPEWTKAAAKSEHLSFVSKSVDAANAPMDLMEHDGKKTFRLFFLAFHHFDDPLAREILRNTLDTADGFGYEVDSIRLHNILTQYLIASLNYKSALYPL
jgi:hypothetical protein